MKKRVIAILTCLFIVGAMLAACGNTEGAGATSAADVQTEASESAEASDATTGADDPTEVDTETESIEVMDASEGTSDEETQNTEIYAGDAVTLKLTSHDPETSATGTFLNNFAAKVSDMSDGLITIDVYHGGTLAGPKDSIDAVTNGSVDIAWGMQSFYDGMFPVTEAFMLPMLDIKSAPQATEALWDFWNTTDYMQAEYADWHVLLLHCNCQTPLTISSKSKVQPETVEQLKGLTCRGNAGPPTMFIEQLGMTPKGCAINDLYSNLEKGEMDACLTDWHGVSAFKINEVASRFYDEDLGTMTYFMLMNKDSYDALSPLAQSIIDQAAEESIQYTDAWDIVQDNIKAEAEAEGKLRTFSDAEEDKLEEAAEAVKDAWIAKTENGQEIYDKVVERLALHK